MAAARRAGHALNKILKDMINRYQILRGRRVRYVPGWDCHGLPIELKVLQAMEPDARAALTPIKLRYKAKAFALKAVEAQREQFKRYGVWGDWAEPYLTLQPEYEAAQARAHPPSAAPRRARRASGPAASGPAPAARGARWACSAACS